MNQPSNPRKKLAKCPSGIHPSQASKHKLRRISSTSTYVIDDEDELERMKNVTLESPSSLDLKKDAGRTVKSIDKTTSSTAFCTGRKAWNHCNAKPSSTFVPDNSIIEEESELIGALTKQLYLVESQMQVVQSNLKKKEEQLKTRDQEVTKLKRKIKEWESKSKELDALKKKEQQQRHTQKENSEQLYRRCLTLERRIHEMETPSCMSLKFYKNGMIVQDGLLRLYDDPATVSFLRDILEGYFPSELQQEYPNGVPFKIEDKRKQMYLGDSIEFPGQGYRLGKQPQADNIPVVQSKPRRPGTTSLKSSRRSTPQKDIQSGFNHAASPSTSRIDNSDESAKQRTRSSSLPNSRISINSNPTSRPFSGFNNVDESNIPVAQRSNSKRNPRGGKPSAPAKPSAPPILHQVNEPSGKSGELRLKVRSLNGGTVYLVHVSADEPIARLYQLLDKAMARTVPRGYKIVLSGYSPRRLDQLGATLREIGIARDSVLHLVND